MKRISVWEKETIDVPTKLGEERQTTSALRHINIDEKVIIYE